MVTQVGHIAYESMRIDEENRLRPRAHVSSSLFNFYELRPQVHRGRRKQLSIIGLEIMLTVMLAVVMVTTYDTILFSKRVFSSF